MPAKGQSRDQENVEEKKTWKYTSTLPVHSVYSQRAKVVYKKKKNYWTWASLIRLAKKTLFGADFSVGTDVTFLLDFSADIALYVTKLTQEKIKKGKWDRNYEDIGNNDNYPIVDTILDNLYQKAKNLYLETCKGIFPKWIYAFFEAAIQPHRPRDPQQVMNWEAGIWDRYMRSMGGEFADLTKIAFEYYRKD